MKPTKNTKTKVKELVSSGAKDKVIVDGLLRLDAENNDLGKFPTEEQKQQRTVNSNYIVKAIKPFDPATYKMLTLILK